MDFDISGYKQSLDKIVSRLKEELKTIRTGHANPSIIENLVVEAYGGQSKLKLMELASIITEGPSSLIVMPFDPSVSPEIEKSILKSPLGLTPQTQGSRIIIRIPPLSQEQREKFIRLINQMVEDKRVAIRTQRDEIRKKIKNSFENNQLSEDEKFRLEKEIESITQKSMEDIQTVKENKEKEVREV